MAQHFTGGFDDTGILEFPIYARGLLAILNGAPGRDWRQPDFVGFNMPGIVTAESEKPATHRNGKSVKETGLACAVDPNEEVHPRVESEFPAVEGFEVLDR